MGLDRVGVFVRADMQRFLDFRLDDFRAVPRVADGVARDVGEPPGAVAREQVQPGAERAGHDRGERTRAGDGREAEVGERPEGGRGRRRADARG